MITRDGPYQRHSCQNLASLSIHEDVHKCRRCYHPVLRAGRTSVIGAGSVALQRFTHTLCVWSPIIRVEHPPTEHHSVDTNVFAAAICVCLEQPAECGARRDPELHLPRAAQCNCQCVLGQGVIACIVNGGFVCDTLNENARIGHDCPVRDIVSDDFNHLGRRLQLR